MVAWFNSLNTSNNVIYSAIAPTLKRKTCQIYRCASNSASACRAVTCLNRARLIRIQSAFDRRSERTGQRDENRSDRLLLCPPGRPGDAGDPQREIRAELFPGALGHFPRDGVAHRTARRKGFGPDAQKLPLHGIAVGDHAPQENRRCARHIREPMRHATAGAGFRQGECLFSLREQPENRCCQCEVRPGLELPSGKGSGHDRAAAFHGKKRGWPFRISAVKVPAMQLFASSGKQR